MHRHYVDPARTVARIQQMLAAEPTANLNTVAFATGLDYQTVVWIMDGTTRRVLNTTERAVLATTARKLRRELFKVSIVRPVQVVSSLRAQGWPLAMIATMLGQDGQSAPQFIHRAASGTTLVTAELAERVEALAERIGDRTGPSARTALLARGQGLYPLIYYGDDGQLIADSVPSETDDASAQGRRPGPARLEAALPRRWAALRSVTVDGLALTVAEDLHGIRLRHRPGDSGDLWSTLGIRFVKLSRSEVTKRQRAGRALVELTPDSRQAWAVLTEACRRVPVDWVALERGKWSAADIDSSWDAAAAWVDLLAELRRTRVPKRLSA